MWTNIQIRQHKEAAKRLLKIKDQTFDFIGKNKRNISELEVQNFLYQKFKEYNLKTDNHPLIIAFGENSANPHYSPTEKTNKKLKTGDIIKLDIWARLSQKGAPFSDITWMAFRGNIIPKEIRRVFNTVIKARDIGIEIIKNNLKKKKIISGHEIDKAVREFVHKSGYSGKFIHGTGHSLGFYSPHGNQNRLRPNSHSYLYKNIAYTIEPGIYLDGKFGVRSEIDFYINNKFKFILTTKLQKEIIKL
ncbi:MAG TPA: M24 family metallopeptidase [Candidatus Moranbacteria bacterium]|nr:M24 family metallopeptidase [Candidatus Moranbacteria bacterium]